MKGDVLAVAHRKRAPILAIVAGVVVLQFMLQVVWPAASQLTHGFSAYDTASRLVREGWSVDRFYDDRWFQAQTDRLGFVGAEDIYNLNPPATSLLFWSLAPLSPSAGKAVWTGVNVLLLGLAWWGLVRMVNGGLVEGAIGAILIALFQPVREDVRLGQVYALLLALEVAALWLYVERRSVLAGLPLGLLVGIKLSGASLVGLLVGQRRWRGLGVAVLTIGSVVAGSALAIGGQPWVRYSALLVGSGPHPELAVTAYQSLPGLFLHLFTFDRTWNPAPLAAASPVAWLLIAASALAVVGVTFRATWSSDPSSRRGRALAFAAWAAVDVALSPVSEDYHYTLLLAPIAILLADWRDHRTDGRWLAVLLVGIGLIGVPLPYKAESLTVGAAALLAYPKLYGALLLWALAMLDLRRVRWDRVRQANSVRNASSSDKSSSMVSPGVKALAGRSRLTS